MLLRDRLDTHGLAQNPRGLVRTARQQGRNKRGSDAHVPHLRPDSSTFRRHAALVLDADTGNALYVPPGVAHGFQTLVDACEVTYMMTEAYRPELAAGVRFDDPAFRIDWPLPVICIASRDRTYADLDPIAHRLRFTGSPELPAAGAARIDNS